ncbi:MAG: NAD-dependent epimerase/dehydratase family protein [Myxococcota bacterium]|nr:NAD-dependent epimerase/dehydratase family protein [Myxococcota bacterium]
MRILITGISGALARMLAKTLADNGHQIAGIDRRPWVDPPKDIQVHQADIRKRPAEEVFRSFQPEVLVHMATVTHLNTRFEERYRINMNGTRAVFENCAKYDVKQAIFVGRHTIYGAAPDSPLYHTEAEPPLAASTYPELSDLVAADLFAGSALWRWPTLNTAVLRLVYTLGPTQRGPLSSFLSAERVPTVLGFDPLFQFMHEQDACDAISATVESRLRGVFNVAGPPGIPLSVLIRGVGKTQVPIPEFLFERMLGRAGLSDLPSGAVNHIKYSITVDDSEFRKITGFDPQYDESRVMHAFRYV